MRKIILTVTLSLALSLVAYSEDDGFYHHKMGNIVWNTSKDFLCHTRDDWRQFYNFLGEKAKLKHIQNYDNWHEINTT